MIDKLPPEIVDIVIAKISINDLRFLRLVSQKLRIYCDHPIHWRSISLKPPSDNNDVKTTLWKLEELKKIIDPHASLIESIRIWGVRDNIVNYLLSSCPNLQHLTICGWTTLSDHCLGLLPTQSLKIKTLELISTSQETNFVSIDALALGKLLDRSPDMNSLVLGCENQVNAESLVAELERNRQVGSNLQRFMFTSHMTNHLHNHISRLKRIYPHVQEITIRPRLLEGLDLDKEHFSHWVIRKLKESHNIARFTAEEDEQLLLISLGNCILYNKSITPLNNVAI